MESSSIFKIFIYFWLRWVFTAALGLPPVVERRGSSLAVVLVAVTGSVAVTLGPSCLRHVEPSQSRDRTHIP